MNEKQQKSKKSLECNCQDWINNIDKLDAPFILAWTHGMSYDGKEFMFCPWCGQELMNRELIESLEEMY